MDKNTLDETLESLDEDFERGDLEDAELEEENDEGEELDNDFEYDDEENIVIHNDTDDREGSKTPDDAKAGEVEQKDEEKENLKSEIQRIKAQAKETLEKLGVKIEDDDVFSGLVKLAAEADDTTPDEYLKKKAEDEKLEAAKRLIAQQEIEAVRRADLDVLHNMFPETAEYDDISKIPNFKRFGELRIKGLSAEEAYSASHTNAIRATAAAGAKRQSLSNTKSHLHSSVPKGAKDDAITMSKSELAEYRETFPDLNDKEIAMLYQKAKTK